MRKTNLFIVILILLLVTLTGCSNKVNDKKWNKAFSEQAFYNCQVVISDKANEKIKILKYANDAIYLNIEYYNRGQLISEMERYYYTEPTGIIWQYWLDTFENIWYRGKTKTINPETDISDFLNSLAKQYEKFTYNESEQNYQRKVGNELTVVSFENSKVSKIQVITDNGNSLGNTITYEFVDYGKTKITLPNV